MCRGLINKNQHGFCSGRSTLTNLLPYQSKIIKALEEFKQVDAVYTDFSKAFDQVDHNIFLRRLFDIGFDVSAVGWIKSLLSERRQMVKIGAFKSDAICVTSGVPQGGHCSLMFFNLFVDSIFDCFADDFKAYRIMNCQTDQQLLQDDLDRLTQWRHINKLNLNKSKCCLISFFKGSRKYDTSYELCGQPLKTVSKIKDLGVIFDKNLTFVDHINSVTIQSSKMLGFIVRNCRHFSVDTVRSLYSSLVRSKLGYGSVVWSPYQAVHKYTVEKVQHKFLRFCGFKLYIGISDHNYSILEKQLDLKTLSERRICAGLYFLHKIVTGKIDSAELLESVNIEIVTRNRRHNYSSFHIPYHRTNYGMNLPIERYSRYVNQLHWEIFDMSESGFRAQFNRINFIE
ncbi:uncharacterized protein LOC126888303 [Diabrotica virgifera virgifera]|uniref:Reverse transcriptase domain-containing protein n=1 Tax=Diabrotica virgifera virgifera TaxID=50390 RepID=A0ABM5KQD1_DIAVI|nr:uncharacterized protein LOC126888303 [Diabrotica virgifera virgifera]